MEWEVGDILLAPYTVTYHCTINKDDIVLICEYNNEANSYGYAILSNTLQIIRNAHVRIDAEVFNNYIKIGSNGKITDNLAKALYF